MNAEQFQHLRQEFEGLLAASVQDRTELLRLCAVRDPEEAQELERMLAADSRTSLLDQPLIPPDLGSGSKLGPYVLEKTLGQGGMGVVYLATRADGAYKKRVAIKILRRDRGSELFLNRFERERQILAQMDHPHIAAILDAGSTPGREPYFVMEYVDGIPITKYCALHGLTVHRKLELFLQVCDAVQHAHRNLTVHRDLKPSNILVTEAGAVKLLDFGIAKLLEAPADGAAEEATAAILTPEYASPEQIRKEPVTTGSDVFALGILLYELIAGAHPFRRGKTGFDTMRSICEDDPQAPSAVAPRRDAGQIRGELDAIALTALSKRPAWRYSSVEQLAEDVNRYRQGWPVLARGNGRFYRLGKFARRQWLPVTSAALLVLLLAGGIMATMRQAAIAEQAREAAESARAQAELERAEAERARTVANEQKAIAEQRRQEAENERRQERARYLQVRALASSLVFDLHDGIRDLAGSATARRLILGKAQQQLEMLNASSQTAGNDVELQRDLAASYERMGELRLDPRGGKQEGSGAAIDAYLHAVELRTRIAGRQGALPHDQLDLALSWTKLGDGRFFSGEVKQAAVLYQQSWELANRLLKPAPSDVATRRALGKIDERRCVAYVTSGNISAAGAACTEGISMVSALAEAAADDVELQRLIASTEGSYANLLRISNQYRDAEAHARKAGASLARLQTLAPNNAEYRRMAASAETILAQSLAAEHDYAASGEAYRRAAKAMEAAIEVDPADLGSGLRLAVTLLGFSRTLNARGEPAKAHDVARQALELLEQTTEKPGAGAVEKNEYADALLKVDFPDLRQPEKALVLAEQAVGSTGRRNPFFLDTLAWAYFRGGNAAKALEVEREAIALLPAGSKGGLAYELNKGLQAFGGAAEKK